MEETVSRKGAWRRVLGESVAIIASILIAFAIQASWESARDAATVTSHFSGIRDELESSQQLIRDYVALLEESTAATRALLALSPEEAASLSSDSLAAVLDRSIGVGSLTLPTGASEALIASGHLSLVDDEELASRLATWPSQVRRAEQGGSILINMRDGGIIPFMAPYGASLRAMGRSRWLKDYPTSRFPIRAEAMFADPQFESHFGMRGIRVEVTLDAYRRLQAQADSIISEIKEALAN